MACDDLRVEWIFSGQSGGSLGKPVVIIPPQSGETSSGWPDAESGRTPGWPVVVGQSDWSRLPYGHPLNPFSAYHASLDVIWGQSSERVECCPVCGKAKDGPDA